MSFHSSQRSATSVRRLSQLRARIVAQARLHFLTHGFESVTMDDLASELGMSKKTLYTHFATKAQLLNATLEAKFAEAEADFVAAGALAKGNFGDAFAAVLNVFQKHTEEIKPPFLRDVARGSPDLFAKVKQTRRGLCQKHIGALLLAGQKSGEVRKDISASLMVEIVIATIDGVMNPQKVIELSLTPQSGILAIITLFMRGALTEKGRKSL